MAKPRNSLERMAQDAAARLDKVRAAGEQLAFLPDEPGRTPQEAGDGAPGKGGRPKGALGKGSSQLRDWLAARGYRMPEDQLAELAGLASSEGAMLTAMRDAERVLSWAFDGERDKDGNPRTPGASDRLAMFQTLYAMQLRAAEALLPYGTPKAAPEVQSTQQAVLVLPQGAPDRGDQARDVTPKQVARRPGLMPADVAHEMQRNQAVSDADPVNSDGGNRTDGKND